MKILGRTEDKPKLRLATPRMKFTSFFESSEMKWYNNDNISSSLKMFLPYQFREAGIRGKQSSVRTPHLRGRRQVKGNIKDQAIIVTECENFTFTIKYDDEYKVWNNFSMLYQNQMFHYYEYRVMDDGLQVCLSVDFLIRQKWIQFVVEEKKMAAIKQCNESVTGFYHTNYTLHKSFSVFLKSTGQSFQRQEYGVYLTRFVICSTKLSISCSNNLINVKYDEQYNVQYDFSLVYKKKIYQYSEYRLRNENLQICSSNDPRIQGIWRTGNSWEKSINTVVCRSRFWTFHTKSYAVNKHFTVYLAYNSQYLPRHTYSLTENKLKICEQNLRPMSIEYTQEDLLMCSDSIINVNYEDEYKVLNSLTILYKNKMYSYTEYRVLNETIKICNSTDNFVKNIWKIRNDWTKARQRLKSCSNSTLLTILNPEIYIVRKDFSVFIPPTKQVLKQQDYGVFEGKVMVCPEKFKNFAYIKDFDHFLIAPLTALGLSMISLLMLLLLYGILSELRTLPGLNIMSLSFAFLLWLIYLAAFYSVHLRIGTIFKLPCATIKITLKFLTYNIIMNAAVNIYHLRKTFGGNIQVNGDENKWKTFFQYCLFSWAVPGIITVVYIILVNANILRYRQSTSFCVNAHDIPDSLAFIEQYGLPCILMFFILITFIFTAYRIRKMLKESKTIAEKSNIVQQRKSFILLLKLLTTTSIAYFPFIFEDLMGNSIHINIILAIETVAYLSGVYVGIAFVFTKNNYRLLRKKYFSRKIKPVE